MAYYFGSCYLTPNEVSGLLSCHYDEMQQSESELELKQSIQSQIENILSQLDVCQRYFTSSNDDTRCVVHVTGSTVDGFGLKGCCLDLTLVKAEIEVDDLVDAVGEMKEEVCRQLENITVNHRLVNVSMIPCHRVPILEFTFQSAEPGEGATRVECDLSIRHASSIKNTKILHWYAIQDHRVPMLYAVIRKWASRKAILGARNGRLNSISWKCLLIHYLQKGCSPPVLQVINKNCFLQRQERYGDDLIEYNNVAELLQGFFVYYSRFDFANNRVAIAKPSIPQRTLDEKSHFPVFIEDPQDENSNLARALTCDNFIVLIGCLRVGYHDAIRLLSDEDTTTRTAPAHRNLNILPQDWSQCRLM